jgi:hypothetical protein
MSTLTGYAISTGILSTDHTYVKSDHFTWPCWGRSEGGKSICQGNGDESIANCLSQENSHAGIVYGVTGVCHQTANRILYPANVTVSKAGGYSASTMVYGTYGTFGWENRKAECSVRFEASSAAGIKSNLEYTPEHMYIQKVVDLYSEDKHLQTELDYINSMENANNLIKKELEYTLEFLLGSKLDSQSFNQIQKQQADLLKEKDKKINELYNSDISTEKYVKEINDLFGDALLNLQKNLGEELFEKIFDLPSNMGTFVLIDPEIAKNSLKIKKNNKR